MLVQVIICLTLLLGSSLSNPIDAPKAKKQLDLSYSCMKIVSGTQNEDRNPILLLHGLAMFKETWMGLYQIIALKTGRRVCVADLRNHGDSPWSDESDIDSMAGDLNRLLTTLQAKKFILLGHSLGGKIAVHFALKNPDKVEKLIVEDMRPNGITPEALQMVSVVVKLLQSSISIVPKRATEAEAKTAVFKYFQDSLAKVNITFNKDKKFADFLPIRCSKDKCSWKTNLKVLAKAMKNPEASMTISTGLFDKPALFIYGKKSPFRVGDDEEEIKKLFPNATLTGVEDAAHTVNDKPEYLDAVIKFINSKN